MRILYESDVFCELFQRYREEPNLKGCIVMRTAHRAKLAKSVFNLYRDAWDLAIQGKVVAFRKSRSMIKICCLANRPTIMFDEIIIDELIDDLDAIEKLKLNERPQTIDDFGKLEPSSEIIEFIGGLDGDIQ